MHSNDALLHHNDVVSVTDIEAIHLAATATA